MTNSELRVGNINHKGTKAQGFIVLEMQGSCKTGILRESESQGRKDTRMC